MIPNNSNTIGIVIFILTTLNKHKSDSIITITDIDIFIAFAFFQVITPIKIIFSNFLVIFEKTCNNHISKYHLK